MIRTSKDNILAFVLAGGRGERLYPLTLDRTKPSVPFGGKYRIIDFALSSLVNSGIYSIYVLVQYKSQSLIEHIRTSWRKFGVLSRHFITVVPPQMRRQEAGAWYRGTADSIYHNINLIYDFKPRFVVILGGDHVYRMNIKEMIDYHIRKKSRVTIAAIPTQAKEAHKFGVLETDDNFKVKKFKEKPSLSKNETILASMGNYIFDTDCLIDILTENAEQGRGTDFAKDIIGNLVQKKDSVYAYDFSKNKIPGLKRYEAKYYWKDVGTISAYWQANMDLLNKNPLLDLDNRSWPIYAPNYECPPAYIVGSQVENCLVSEGTKIFDSKIENSIIGRSVFIEEGCEVENSIIMDFTHIGRSCKVKNVIVDRYNTIDKKTSIGYDNEADKKNYYLDSSGIVVVKRGSRKTEFFLPNI